MTFSLIIPVFNRPDEVDELLQSLCTQTDKDFEVIVVEDGSTLTCDKVVARYEGRLDVHYFTKPNSGPGQTRNFGAERAQGDYYVVLDSDVVLPDGYVAAMRDELRREPADAWGGPDRAHPDFSPVQKAINYSMTSFFTTGGIRGGKKKLDKFYPRSFNMGLRAGLWHELGGFSKMRFGEDIDLSIRIFRSGARCRLFPDAWVWHKRRTDFRKFFKQVHNSGIARVNLYKKYPDSLKVVHLLPAVFTIGVALLLLVGMVGLVLAIIGLWGMCVPMEQPGCNLSPVVLIGGMALLLMALSPIIIYAIIIIADSKWQNHSIRVGLLSVPAAFIQLIGYGTGFLRAWWLRCICGRDEELQAFRKNFYQ